MEGDGNDKLGTVAALKEVLEGMLNLLGNSAGLNEFQVLGFDVVGTADLSKHGFAFFMATTLYQTVGSVHHQQGSYGQ